MMPLFKHPYAVRLQCLACGKHYPKEALLVSQSTRLFTQAVWTTKAGEENIRRHTTAASCSLSKALKKGRGETCWEAQLCRHRQRGQLAGGPSTPRLSAASQRWAPAPRSAHAQSHCCCSPAIPQCHCHPGRSRLAARPAAHWALPPWLPNQQKPPACVHANIWRTAQ